MNDGEDASQCRFQVGDAGRSGLVLAVLVGGAVGCMVGGDAVDDAIAQSSCHREAVGRLAQGRVDLGAGVVRGQRRRG